MKKIFFAIALAVVATACHTNEGDKRVKVGSIAINAATRREVSNTSEEGRFYLTDVPAVEDLRVDIVGSEYAQSWSSLSAFNAECAEGLTFTSAPYSITLSHGEMGAEGWSKPYFKGSTTVEVPQFGLTAEANVEVVLQNSIIAIEATDEFKGYFPQHSFKVKNIAWETEKGELLFLNAGVNSPDTLSMKPSKEVSFSHMNRSSR